MPAAKPRRRISGVLLLDKPVRISSNHALQAAKRMFHADKAGHAGTLDPLASGLLPVFFGDATRFCGHLLDSDKRYIADIKLGIRTRTGDAEGKVLECLPVAVDGSRLATVLGQFLGVQAQIPPMYSALKRDGEPLYALARRGETVERAPRTIQIRKLDLLEFEGDKVVLDVTCSKGTYIRTLAEDIGAALGCGAHLSGLRRIATGALELAQAVSLDALQAMTEERRDATLLPVDTVLGGLPGTALDASQGTRFRQGQALACPGLVTGLYRVYGQDTGFLGLGEVLEAGRLTPKRLLAGLASVQPRG